MGATVTTKGQITIPKRIRDLLGIRPGSVIDFARNARLSRFARLRGHAGKGPSTDEVMALLRPVGELHG